MHTFHFTRVSSNSKTGPIPVTTSSKSTCPPDCPLKGNGCYAETGPLGMHWHQVSIGNRGITLDELCDQIKKLPKHQLWRWGQAGDFPGDDGVLDATSMSKIVRANDRREAISFTHYDPSLHHNWTVIDDAISNGFTINLSANNLEHADELYDHGVAPVVTVLPMDTTKPVYTPKGRMVAICPATQRDDIQCSSCGICANADRKAIIGFPAHGTGAKKAQAMFFTRNLTSNLEGVSA